MTWPEYLCGWAARRSGHASRVFRPCYGLSLNSRFPWLLQMQHTGGWQIGFRKYTRRNFLNLDDGTLKTIGFSRQKTGYAGILARSILSGELDLEGLARMDDDSARTRLMSLKGIGQWTADIYLLTGFAPGGYMAGWRSCTGTVCAQGKKSGRQSRMLRKWRKLQNRGNHGGPQQPACYGITT